MELTSGIRSINSQIKIIWAFTTVCGFVVLGSTLSHFDVSLWGQVAVFVLLAFAAQLMPARLPQGADFSVAFIMDLILVTLYGTPAAIVTGAVVTVCAGLFSGLLGRREPLFKTIKSTGQVVLVIGLAGTVYQFLAHPIVAFTGAAVAYFLAVTFFFALDSLLKVKESFGTSWLGVMRTVFVNFFVLSSLAYLLTYLLSNSAMEFKLFSVFLFFVPVMLVSHAFRLSVNIKQSYLNTVRTVARAMEAKDPYTKGHSESVAELTMALARELRIPERELQKLEFVALLHDAGKIGVREEILNKTAPLTVKEYEEVQKHSNIGAEIIQKIKFLSSKSDIVLYHHERYDGTGYPSGLQGEEIPLESRIIAVADAYNAMITDRPFRKAKSADEAVREMNMLSGQQFDPRLVELFKNILKRRGEI